MKTNKTFKLLALAVGLSLAGFAQASTAPLPKDLPAYGPEKPLPTPQIQQRTLPNGLTVWVVPREGLPKVDVELAVLGGSAADDAATPAMSEMMARLLDEGTATRSSLQIAETLRSIGGDYRTGAAADAVVIRASALASHAPELLALVADTALHPSFPAKEVALAQANAMQELKVQESSPAWQAQRAFDHAAFGAHPYARDSLSEATVKASDPAALRALHEARFQPDRSLLVIVGRIGADQAFRLASQQFGGWKSDSDALAKTPPAPREASIERLIVPREGAVQTNIRYGRPAIPASNPDFIPLTVADTILGGSFTSRIVQDIREEKGYSYSPRSLFDAQRAGGSTLARVDVRNDVTGATLKELAKLYDGMATRAPSEEELTGAKRFVGGIYLLRNQIQGALTATLAGYWVDGLPPDFLSGYVADANKVTAEQVQAMGRKYFASKDQSIVVVGDPKAIDAQLKPFGAFKVYKP
ncbi:M16 family metallopeptidase [Frateuria hangzhouensis]|uniref:M16 family metallopeptidase n=1 Tax=Frateuria hangzhouensis TaxID=2995589 RepID=UPI0022609038|nr:pitrilysin family protein [Frateuria sp. STR12]MCX7513616.1 pitrilysin family protein [Frateuria sp. STR12]